MSKDMETIRKEGGKFFLTVKICPACGEDARGLQITFTGLAHCYRDKADDVEFQFNGHTPVVGRGGVVLTDLDQVIVSCINDHLWFSKYKPVEKKP